MIKDITIQATAKDGHGKGFARRLRAKGLIPAAVYGEGQDAAAVAINARDIANILRSDTGHNTIFKIALPGGEPTTVIIKDWQVDPLKGRLLHADLKRLSLTSITRVRVAIHAIGEPIGVKTDGGLLEISMREVEVECLPHDIPESLEVQVGHMNIGDHVTVADLVYDREKIKVLSDEHQLVAGVLASRMAEAAPGAEVVPGETTAEPEVIKKGKTEEEK
ncbi:MAG: 50S ribosomal protein L25 [Blastocatellia bacterium AA13]|nr:MAG: 50S ribosomal protein L25 [Blastocatellia bacterium AA13]